MESATIPYLTRCVALLAEGVDRNREDTRYLTHYIVALLAEGVDRNWKECGKKKMWLSRPPRGGRG